MKRPFMLQGAMPEKVDHMHFDELFRIMSTKFLQNFSAAITSLYPDGNFPISEFQDQHDNWGGSDSYRV